MVVDLGVEPDSVGFTNNGAFLMAYNDSLTPAATVAQLKGNAKLIADMERVARWQEEVLRAKNSKWMRGSAYRAAKILQPVLAELGCALSAESLKSAMEYAWNTSDDVKTKLEILKASPSYAADTIKKPNLEYALPSDSLLAATREYFNLDSVAGNGDDVSRIKNLLYWVHNNIPHDGGNGLAPGAREPQEYLRIGKTRQLRLQLPRLGDKSCGSTSCGGDSGTLCDLSIKGMGHRQ